MFTLFCHWINAWNVLYNPPCSVTESMHGTYYIIGFFIISICNLDFNFFYNQVSHWLNMGPLDKHTGASLIDLLVWTKRELFLRFRTGLDLRHWKLFLKLLRIVKTGTFPVVKNVTFDDKIEGKLELTDLSSSYFI